MKSEGRSFPTRLLCAIVFCIFTFCYLFFYQADIMVISQHIASGGQTHYEPLIGAVLITTALLLIQLGVFSITKIYKRTHALTYIPSALVLTLITSISTHVTDTIELGAWWVVFPLVLTLFFIGTYFLRHYQSLTPEVQQAGFTSHMLWMNLLELFFILLCVCLFSNTDEAFHRQAKMERLLMENKIDEAIEVGQQTKETSSSLTLVRGYALTLRKQMGENFFETPVTCGSASITADSLHSHALMLPKARVEMISAKGVDFILTKMLMDRKLDDFARNLPKYYNLKNPLPKHYREALLVYQHQSKYPLYSFHDSKMEKAYAEFLKIRKNIHHQQADSTTPDENSARMLLQQNFGKTYWYYYAMNN